MRYRVGELVRVKSTAWYTANSSGAGFVRSPDGYRYALIAPMAKYCGRAVYVTSVSTGRDPGEYQLKGCGDFAWEDWMLEPFTIENVKECAP
jgi:hypothetical protein